VQRISQQLGDEGRVTELHAHVEANPGDLVGQMFLEHLLHQRPDVEGLRAWDEDSYGSSRLIALLVEQGRIDEVIDEMHAGNKNALEGWAQWLAANGHEDRAQQLRRYGTRPDGTLAEEH
jgi:hypothetical protein